MAELYRRPQISMQVSLLFSTFLWDCAIACLSERSLLLWKVSSCTATFWQKKFQGKPKIRDKPRWACVSLHLNYILWEKGNEDRQAKFSWQINGDLLWKRSSNVGSVSISKAKRDVRRTGTSLNHGMLVWDYKHWWNNSRKIRFYFFVIHWGAEEVPRSASPIQIRYTYPAIVSYHQNTTISTN